MYCSAFQAMGTRGITTMRKISVSAERTSVRASSFGVRCRIAPSTSAIILSRNDSPPAPVIRTVMLSEITSVPPTTPDRSPPDSRMTGADSPVIADSSIDAMPVMISPSPGMIWPALTTTPSPARKSVDATSSVVPSVSMRYATVSRRVRRKLSAWALPRASAIAVAKFANSTVTKSHASKATK